MGRARSAIFLISAWLFDAARRTVIFILDQRDIAVVDDKDCAHCIVGQILGALKEGNRSNCRQLSRSLNYGCVALALFIDTDGPEW